MMLCEMLEKSTAMMLWETPEVTTAAMAAYLTHRFRCRRDLRRLPQVQRDRNHLFLLQIPFNHRRKILASVAAQAHRLIQLLRHSP
jgi:hypothetical protein